MKIELKASFAIISSIYAARIGFEVGPDKDQQLWSPDKQKLFDKMIVAGFASAPVLRNLFDEKSVEELSELF